MTPSKPPGGPGQRIDGPRRRWLVGAALAQIATPRATPLATQFAIPLAALLQHTPAQAQTPAHASATATPQRSSGGGLAALPPLGQSLRLPDEIALLDGKQLRPVHERHTVLVMYWWASWCPFCAIQSPLIDTLWRAHRQAGLRVLGLSIDKRREDAVDHLRAKGYGFPSAWVTPEIEQRLPRPKGLPVTLVLGRDGKVLMAEAGQLFPEDIEQIARYL